MPSIFSRLGLMAAVLILSACGAKEHESITPPKDVAAIVEPFLTALRKGQKEEAKKFVVAGATDELDAQFGADHVRLAKGPKLKPRLIELREAPAYGAGVELATINYAGLQDGAWTSATVRAVRSSAKDPYRIEYWRVTSNPPSIATGGALLAETASKSLKAKLIFWGTITLFVAICLALLIWAIRNRTRPDGHLTDEGRRPPASTTRD